MQPRDSLISLRVGKMNGEEIRSPMLSSFNWEDGILTSACSRDCEAGHPQQNCSCGIYSVLDNGLHELANYINSSEHVVFVGWAFSTVHVYDWGLRSGQWVAVGVVNWHGYKDKTISPYHDREPWWDSAYSALNLLRTRNVDNPKLYEMDTVINAIQQQIKLMAEREMAFNQLFVINQKEKDE